MARQTVRELLVKITGDEAQLERSLERSARSIDRVGRRVEGLGRRLTTQITAPAVAAAAGIFALTTSSAAYADEIDKTSIRTGIARGTLQELRFVADQTGVSFDGLTGVVEAFTRRIPQIDQGTSETAKSFNRLGVEIRDRHGDLRSMGALFPEVIAGLSGMENATERNAIATQIFGRRAFEIVPILEAGGEQVQELMQRARDLGIVMGDESIADLVRFKDEMSEVRQQLGAVGREVALGVLPVIQQDLIPFIREAVVPRLRDWAAMLRGVDGETLKTVGGVVMLTAALPPLVWGIGSVIRTSAQGIQVLSTLLATKAAIGTLLVPGGIVLAGLALLAVGFARSRLEAAQSAVAIAGLRAEIIALSEAERDLRMEEVEANLAEAVRQLGAASAELGRVKEQSSDAMRAFEAGFGGMTLDMTGPERSFREAFERVQELSRELGMLRDAERRSEDQKRRLVEIQGEIEAALRSGTEAVDANTSAERSAADVLEDLNERKRIAVETATLLGDETSANTQIAAAYEAALRELVSMEDDGAEAARAVAAALRALRGEMADAAAEAGEFRSQQALVASLLAATITPAERLIQAEEALEAVRAAGKITTEEYNVALAEARERYREVADEAEDAGEAFAHHGSALERTLASNLNALSHFAADGSRSFSRFTDSVIRDLRRLAAQFAIFQLLNMLFPGSGFVAGLGQSWGFGGGRAMGGPVDPGRTFLVGEHGPELFRPPGPGIIEPNHRLRGAGGGTFTLRLDRTSLPPRPTQLTPDGMRVDDWWMRAWGAMKLEYDERGGL